MHIHDLPLPLREKMIYYAHPKMNDELKRAIKVTACHYYLKSIYNKWQNDFEQFNMPISWENTLARLLSNEKQNELIDGLKQCGAEILFQIKVIVISVNFLALAQIFQPSKKNSLIPKYST